MSQYEKWQVGYWMKKLPESVAPNESTRNAFNKMRSGNYRHLLVMQDQKLLGIISDRDLRRPDIKKGEDGWDSFYNPDEDYKVSYVMSTDPKTTSAEDDIVKAIWLFEEYRFGALPVVDKTGAPIGILSVYDLLLYFDEIIQKHGHETKGK